MNRPGQTQALERLCARTLRALPSRCAPDTLQSRVFAELDRRAQRPWWLRGYHHWPGVVRAGFVAVCAGLIGLSMFGGAWALTRIASLPWAGGLPIAWRAPALALRLVGSDLARSLVRAVPLSWLYAGVALAAALYALLFALGATAYRLLCLSPRAAPRSSTQVTFP